MVNKWIKTLQYGLFPPTCILCGSPGESCLDICRECRNELPRNTSHCRRCAEPLSIPGTCGSCLKRPPLYDLCFSPFLYQQTIADLIAGFKFNAKLQSGRLLAQLMVDEVVGKKMELPDLLIPVPLHGKRLRERGYNQSLEITKYLASRLRLPFDNRCCRRLRSTEQQSNLSKKKRASNVRNAFKVQGAIPRGHITLLDDVVTTGSTVNELARQLKRAGAIKVSVWSIARTP